MDAAATTPPNGSISNCLKAVSRWLRSGQTSGINRVLETSTIKQLTGGGEIIGADLYRSEVHGEVKFKLVSLMNEAPHIEPDAAFKRRVQVFPFRARFDEVANPGCIALAMERKMRSPPA